MANKTNKIRISQLMSSANKDILEYIPPCTIKLNLPFIITINKELSLGMPYMLLEGNHVEAIRLLDLWDSSNMVYLKVQELASQKTCIISWNLEYKGEYWLWSLADYPSLQIMSIINTTNNDIQKGVDNGNYSPSM